MKNLIIKLHQKALQYPILVKAFHTAWQVALAYIIVNISAAHSTADVKGILVTAGALALSAVKSTLWPVLVGYASSGDPHIQLPNS